MAESARPIPLEPTTPRGRALAHLRAAFAAAGIETAALDARLLASAALEVERSQLALDPDIPIGTEGATRLASFAARRLAREPVARILGHAEFWSLPFELSPETLVPRPDTESVIEAALALASDREAPLRILDLGTGSGCLLVTLLHERPQAVGLATDLAQGALATAGRNATRNGVGGRALFAAMNWTQGIAGPFDLVVSNPPYIRSSDREGLAPEVGRHDPALALEGGRDGLEAYRAILADAPRLLAPGGALVVEIGFDQEGEVRALAAAAGLRLALARRDLGGHVRALAFAAP